MISKRKRADGVENMERQSRSKLIHVAFVTPIAILVYDVLTNVVKRQLLLTELPEEPILDANTPITEPNQQLEYRFGRSKRRKNLAQMLTGIVVGGTVLHEENTDKMWQVTGTDFVWHPFAEDDDVEEGDDEEMIATLHRAHPLKNWAIEDLLIDTDNLKCRPWIELAELEFFVGVDEESEYWDGVQDVEFRLGVHRDRQLFLTGQVTSWFFFS